MSHIKNKTLRMAVDVILIIVSIVFLVFGIKDTIDMSKASATPDNVLFKKSYRDVEEDNPYKYITDKEYDKMLKSGTGVIFIGNPNDTWSQVLARPLTDIIESYEGVEVYYFETEDDIPRVLILNEGNKIDEIKKSDIFEEQYDGIPLEYFEQEEHRISLEKSLEVITKIYEKAS